MRIKSIVCSTAMLAAFGASPFIAGQSYASTAHHSGKTSTRMVDAKEVNGKYGFAPKKITVKVGTTVVWKNMSDAEHNVTFDSGPKVNKDFEEGKGVSFHFTKAGTYRYHCEYHPYMKGTVVVTH